MSDKERELVEYFIKIVEETPSLHEKWINPPIKITTWKHLLELDKRLEDIKIINEEHRVLNGKLREELEFEKATNKELLSTGAELENKLYEEQDKNIRLNNIINELEKWLEDKDKNALQDDNYWEVLDKLKELRKIYE